jgi:6-pyruvoyltetrahydropterin/6-carboxytetrahydropterin synthase
VFEVTVEESFAAGHALRGYKGKCENVHGHNYKVRVVVAGEKLDSVGMLYNFVELRRQMADIIRGLDHQFLNELPPFTETNPSAENIARYFYDQLVQRVEANPKGVSLREVTVFESEGTTATYHPRP